MQYNHRFSKRYLNVTLHITCLLYTSLAGSLAGKDGVNIVSGTGSIGLGKDSTGTFARCGGWGDYVGDEGSAHWIGKKTLEIFSKEADNRLEKGDLYYNIREKLNMKCCKIVITQGKPMKKQVQII